MRPSRGSSRTTGSCSPASTASRCSSTACASCARDVRALHRARVAAVGSETAAALGGARRAGRRRAGGVPRRRRSPRRCRRRASPAQRVLLPRAAVAREILPALLRSAGARRSTKSPAIQTVAAARRSRREVRDALGARQRSIWSPSPARARCATSSPCSARCRRSAAGTPVGCIGPITADTARAAGLDVAVQPTTYTIAAFTEAIVEYLRITADDTRIGHQIEHRSRRVASAGHRAVHRWLARRRWSFPIYRPRRLRRTETLRRMVRETRLSVDNSSCRCSSCRAQSVANAGRLDAGRRAAVGRSRRRGRAARRATSAFRR